MLTILLYLIVSQRVIVDDCQVLAKQLSGTGKKAPRLPLFHPIANRYQSLDIDSHTLSLIAVTY
jgi:hypothetical protein